MTPVVRRRAREFAPTLCSCAADEKEAAMENVWLTGALWIGLALGASLISIRIGASVALVEIVVGAVAGNLIGLELTPWINFLAGFGAVLLTFLAGAEIDMDVLRRRAGPSFGIGIASFLAPYLGCLLFARYGLGWSWAEAQIAGIALSTTSVAVVYAVMIETGLNSSELGKIILAACFITDLGTVLALGVVFANFDMKLAYFGAATAAVVAIMPRLALWLFRRIGAKVSEPEVKFVLVALFGLGGLASLAKSEAVLPAYLVGMALAPVFLDIPSLSQRLRVIAFAILTPFYFLKAGSLIDFQAVAASAGPIAVFLALKIATKFLGVLPLTRAFKFEPREGIYTTLLMSTGLTFGSISALFGLTNHIIDQRQYTILVTTVILSAVVPTLIAQRWFQPAFKLTEETPASAVDQAVPDEG
jgi:Kef-type K+ transport system membrane component KefB